MPASRRWSTPDAAFFAQLLAELEAPGRRIALKGLPPELEKLLALARGARRPVAAASARRPGIGERIGLAALRGADDARALVALLGEVVLLLPRLLAGRAKIRRAELIEVLAESSSRALPIVAIVNLLMGAILAFVGAVQLKTFGAGIYVANLVGIASVRELTPIITAIVLAGRTGASFAARIATMQGNEEIDALTTLGVSPVEFLVLPRVIALCLLMPLLYVYGCALRAARRHGRGDADPRRFDDCLYGADAARDRRRAISRSAPQGARVRRRSSRCSAATTDCARRAARPASVPPPPRPS